MNNKALIEQNQTNNEVYDMILNTHACTRKQKYILGGHHLRGASWNLYADNVLRL
jgi:hypothetical protein